MMVMLFVAVQVLGLGMQAEREKFAAGLGKRMLKRLAIDDNNSVCLAVNKSNILTAIYSQRLAILCEACRVRKNEKFFLKGGCLTTSCL